MLITTRESKRWTIPKGWPIPGLSSHRTAEREAWEEEGVIGKVKRKLYDHFRHAKVLDDRREVEVVVAVHMLKVQRRKKQFPEMAERHVAWMRPAEAANCVREPDLKQLLLSVS
ncbi:NUDIX hydrolase [Rhizobium grahamii]|uniref:NUDIX hydrolase n=1 Tax=Rhizobium grahamii TaxID=1120045 RepID=UPI00313820D3